LPNVEIRVSSGFSTNLADDLQRGKLDVAFLRREPKPDLEGYLPSTITSRRLVGEQPTVDLVLGYRKSNASPLLKTFLSRIDGLADQIYKTPGRVIERHGSHRPKPGLASMA
jgi:hypothetical protein